MSRIFHAGRSNTPSGMRPENPRASIARLIVVSAYGEYEALPESQRRASDLVLVKGV